MINRTIKDFGNTLELKDLEFNENHLIHLDFQTIGDLYIEDTPPYLYMYLTKPLTNPSPTTYQKALLLCHFKQKNPYPTSVGLYEDNKLSFLLRIPYDEITESNLEKALLFLNKLHEQVK